MPNLPSNLEAEIIAPEEELVNDPQSIVEDPLLDRSIDTDEYVCATTDYLESALQSFAEPSELLEDAPQTELIAPQCELMPGVSSLTQELFLLYGEHFGVEQAELEKAHDTLASAREKVRSLIEAVEDLKGHELPAETIMSIAHYVAKDVLGVQYAASGPGAYDFVTGLNSTPPELDCDMMTYLLIELAEAGGVEASMLSLYAREADQAGHAVVSFLHEERELVFWEATSGTALEALYSHAEELREEFLLEGPLSSQELLVAMLFARMEPDIAHDFTLLSYLIEGAEQLPTCREALEHCPSQLQKEVQEVFSRFVERANVLERIAPDALEIHLLRYYADELTWEDMLEELQARDKKAPQ